MSHITRRVEKHGASEVIIPRVPAAKYQYPPLSIIKNNIFAINGLDFLIYLNAIYSGMYREFLRVHCKLYTLYFHNNSKLLLLFGRSRAQISFWGKVILTEGFRDLPQLLQAHTAAVISIRPPLVPNPSQFVIHQSPYCYLLCSLSNWQLIKQQTNAVLLRDFLVS
jgi:hypothetical protein